MSVSLTLQAKTFHLRERESEPDVERVGESRVAVEVKDGKVDVPSAQGSRQGHERRCDALVSFFV